VGLSLPLHHPFHCWLLLILPYSHLFYTVLGGFEQFRLVLLPCVEDLRRENSPNEGETAGITGINVRKRLLPGAIPGGLRGVEYS